MRGKGREGRKGGRGEGKGMGGEGRGGARGRKPKGMQQLFLFIRLTRHSTHTQPLSHTIHRDRGG